MIFIFFDQVEYLNLNFVFLVVGKSVRQCNNCLLSGSAIPVHCKLFFQPIFVFKRKIKFRIGKNYKILQALLQNEAKLKQVFSVFLYLS
jgi:hypothetical protein